jgi:ABC-type polar amino acid transport system ATPase subunit
VGDNVSFFDSPIDLERVARAARQANVAADIEALPMQYHSMLAEAAADISGGQKQRLFIARALHHAPRVLFLHAATRGSLVPRRLASDTSSTFAISRQPDRWPRIKLLRSTLRSEPSR